MYSSSYSRAKFGLEARESLHKPRGKSCGYYLRIIFFFSSLIQSLIIVSLVLFLIYGQPEKTAEERRVKELDLNLNKLTEDNMQLRKEKADLGAQLTAQLTACTTEKTALEAELTKLKIDYNNTERTLKDKVASCERMSATTIKMINLRPSPPVQPPIMVTSSGEVKTLQSLNAQQKAMIDLIQANFTQTVQYLANDRDNALKDRDTYHQDVIVLRRDNTMLNEQLTAYTRKCKEDFANSLDGIQSVTRDFLNRINNLFPNQMTFHLTCDSQNEQMEKIRSSCTNLSRDVENKFQLYLDKVGNKVADIQALSSRLEVKTSHLTSDLQMCERRRSEIEVETSKQLLQKQKTHDDTMEKLLVEKNNLREQKRLQEEALALRVKELQTLQRMLPNAPSNFKPTVLKPAGLQAAPKQNGPTWPSVGAPSISKTPTVR
ncbi:plasmalemma vesicle associated protein b [Notolabrus celidotus]|uniref:plasmalemma vesicle associated protein b n=1 Tax=Notolabrus celidotus TaxID=1203425 RepID=UPI00148FDE2C|nr:plasmalemma vesicle associated protein b [Notolabrus celidotus]